MASGDVVNTAARLQSAAPVNGILAGRDDLPRDPPGVDYREAAPVEAKGKAEPISVWEALAARSRFGVDVTHARTLRARRAASASSPSCATRSSAHAHERTPQLVTLVGVPGMGKSRLVYELSPDRRRRPRAHHLAPGPLPRLRRRRRLLGARARSSRRRQGSPSETRGGERPRSSTRRSRTLSTDAGDARWVESHLRPLVGLEADTGLGGDRRGEAFAAWRRFLEALAEQRPLVARARGPPLGGRGPARLRRRARRLAERCPAPRRRAARGPSFSSGGPAGAAASSTPRRSALSPLSQDQTALLISHVLDRSLLPAEIQQALLERSGGNPLYAEQFAQLYLERGSAEDMPLPETLQGIVAARLDGLSRCGEGRPAGRRRRRQGVLDRRACARDERDATRVLHSLERKGFLTRQRRSSVESEGEWAFAHMLLRDVAYGQIPRADRAQKHREIGGVDREPRPRRGPCRACRVPLELRARARSSRRQDDHGAREPSAPRATRGGRPRLRAQYVPLAADHYQAALALWPDDDDRPTAHVPPRPCTLPEGRRAPRGSSGSGARRAARLRETTSTRAEAEILLARTLWEQGRRGAADRVSRTRRRPRERRSPSEAKARVLSMTARLRALRGEDETARRIADEALAMADALSLDELRSHSLARSAYEGSARRPDRNRRPGTEPRAGARGQLTIGKSGRKQPRVVSWNNGDVERWRELIPESLRLAQRIGDVQGTRWAQTGLFLEDFMRGRWEQALAGADEFIGMCEAGKPHYMESSARERPSRDSRRAGRHDGGTRRRRALTFLARRRKGPPEPHTVAEGRRTRVRVARPSRRGSAASR